MTGVIEHNKLKLELPANIESIDWAEQRALKFIETHNVETDIFALRIIIRESMANAIVHGCGKRSDKIIQFELQIDDNKIIMRIKDPGRGFNWKQVMKYNDILADRGRGLPIMEIYSDEMYFNEKGNELVLIKVCNNKN